MVVYYESKLDESLTVVNSSSNVHCLTNSVTIDDTQEGIHDERGTGDHRQQCQCKCMFTDSVNRMSERLGALVYQCNRDFRQVTKSVWTQIMTILSVADKEAIHHR